MLRGLERRRLLTRERSKSDGRQSLLGLTAEGKRTFGTLNTRSAAEVRAMLGKLSDAGQRRLVEAMRDVERLLDAAPETKAPTSCARTGPATWAGSSTATARSTRRSTAGTSASRRWSRRSSRRFIADFDPKRERCWIAERDGEIVGSVFLVSKSRTVAQLRLLYVEPSARGLGIGKRLVDECERFARDKGYRKIMLWTNSVLHAARHIYEAAGYRLVAEEPHHSFGHALVGQTWELKL